MYVYIDDEQKKIILSFDIRKQDVSHLEKLLMKLNGKYEVLTQAVIRSISLRKSLNREKTVSCFVFLFFKHK